MTPDWSPLRTALADLRADGVALPLWWRDDDATAPGPALGRLAALSARVALPVHLAVIPALAKPALVPVVHAAGMIPVVHGWAHHDHSEGVGKKNEFLTPRPAAAEDAARGLRQMRRLFGASLLQMFVPPWNRIHPEVIRTLPAQGYTMLSAFGPRGTPQAAPGCTQVNTHLDPIWWKGTRDLVDPDALIAQAAAHLDARRMGDEDSHEPFGVLTHHLVHTQAIWTFTAALLQELLDGGATPWTAETTP
ncbi:MAG: polysaccharide deacetylase [Pseudomonadota bacterium]